MPRGEQIAKPAECGTHAAGLCSLAGSGRSGTERGSAGLGGVGEKRVPSTHRRLVGETGSGRLEVRSRAVSDNSSTIRVERSRGRRMILNLENTRFGGQGLRLSVVAILAGDVLQA